MKSVPLSRSEQMARVLSKGNKSTELRLIQIFRSSKIKGWRRNSKIYGKPDFVFPKQRLAVFVDGIFWHGHPTLCRLPVTNRGYWIRKIQRNKKRDRNVNANLRKSGWRVMRIWEHELTNRKVSFTRRIAQAIKLYSELNG